MLTTSRKQLVERMIERDGMVFRVVFAVSYDSGKTRAEVVKVIPLGAIEEAENLIALPGSQEKSKISEVFKKVFFESFVSPYQNLIFLNGSKPRAPSLR